MCICFFFVRIGGLIIFLLVSILLHTKTHVQKTTPNGGVGGVGWGGGLKRSIRWDEIKFSNRKLLRRRRKSFFRRLRCCECWPSASKEMDAGHTHRGNDLHYTNEHTHTRPMFNAGKVCPSQCGKRHSSWPADGNALQRPRLMQRRRPPPFWSAVRLHCGMASKMGHTYKHTNTHRQSHMLTHWC